MNIHYQLTGTAQVPEGSRLSDSEPAIILPDGTTLKLWEAWERHHPGEDTYRNLTDEELTALGIHYDTLTHDFEAS